MKTGGKFVRQHSLDGRSYKGRKVDGTEFSKSKNVSGDRKKPDRHPLLFLLLHIFKL